MADINKTNKWRFQSTDEDMLVNSYRQWIASRSRFQRAGGKHSDDFNRFETPATMFFRLFFYFGQGNLLDLSYNREQLTATYTKDSTSFANTAYNYLLLNNEYERAEYIKDFVTLLSNINTYSPWYFSKISGLSEALARTEFTGDNYQVKVDRAIGIECLPDSYDMRIGTMLDLYRSAVYSYQLKTEIIPANLRKFDMGILIFNVPIENFSTYIDGDKFSAAKMRYSENSNNYITSSKYIELRNCEINVLGNDEPFGEMDSSGEGIHPAYKIPITFDEAYEQRYNEFTGQLVTDVIEYDLATERNTLDTKYFAYGSSVVGGVEPELNIGEKSSQQTMHKQRENLYGTTESKTKFSRGSKTFTNTSEKDDLATRNENIGGSTEERLLKKGVEKIKKLEPSSLAGETPRATGVAQRIINGILGSDSDRTITGRLQRDLTRRLYFGNLGDVYSASRAVDTMNMLSTSPVQALVTAGQSITGGDGISLSGIASYRENSGWRRTNIENLTNNSNLGD